CQQDRLQKCSLTRSDFVYIPKTRYFNELWGAIATLNPQKLCPILAQYILGFTQDWTKNLIISGG
ncbi:MAG: hypothetical protein ACKPCP_20465, partial [Sphaerospermopsis kisseleviana]